MPAPSQSFERHARYVPMYHFVTLPILIINFCWTVFRLIVGPGIDSAMAVLLALALMLTAWYARVFALRVQDRLIRLEMRQRLAALLPREQHAAIAALSPRQCVAMRFASDAELPELLAAVVKGNIQESKAIKKMIKNWTPDNVRI